MSTEELISMPIIRSLIKETEKKIEEMTGFTISLSPSTTKGDINKDKLVLKMLVEDYFKTPWHLITAKCRKRELVRARFFYAWVCIKILRRTYEETGRDLNSHHTSIIHAIETLNNANSIGDDLAIELKRFLIVFRERMEESELLKTA